MNRTSEFFSYLSKYPKRSLTRVSHTGSIEFVFQTNEIRQRLSHSRNSVRELFRKLKKGNIFGEDEEIINNIIISLNKDLSTIDRMISDLDLIKSKPPHFKNAVQTLQQSLSGITRDFQTLIQKRSQIIQKAQERRSTITSSVRQSNFFDTMYTDEVEYPMNSTQQLEENRERYDLVRNVEKSITEIVSMYQKLSEVIASQEYDVRRIDENANNSLEFLKSGTKQIEKYYDKIKSNKRLAIKIGLIIFVFLLFFILIM